MAKLKAGDIMPDFTFDTPFEKGLTLSGTAGRVPGKTALVFLRYYGCTLCQYDIHLYTQHYDKIRAAGGQLLVVLQSDPQRLASQLGREDLPFDIVCDPDQALYHQFDIRPAPSMEALGDDKVAEKVEAARSLGLSHGEYEGEELQLPAAFVLDGDRLLSYAHYGASASDVPSPEDLEALLR